MESLALFLIYLGYALVARGVLRRATPEARALLFFTVNLGAILAIHCWWPRSLTFSPRVAGSVLAIYLGVVAVQYLLVRFFACRRDRGSLIPVVAPLGFLVLVKYVPVESNPFLGLLVATIRPADGVLAVALWIGLSYMAFRLSYLAIEVRRGTAPEPRFFELMAFAFFLPTLPVGPISSYGLFAASLSAPEGTRIPVTRAGLRILVGGVKFGLLANVLQPLAFTGLLEDGYTHGVADLAMACVAYTLYLYLNFSGFCDIAIGLAGLVGVRVQENFRNPLLARSIQDFWSRWHITLGQYARDVLFTPLSKWLLHRVGPRHLDGVVVVTSILVFLVVGIWHGVGWNFALFGLAHGVGLGMSHLWASTLKKRFGRRYLEISRRPWVHGLAVALTFSFVSASFFLFALDLGRVERVLALVR